MAEKLALLPCNGLDKSAGAVSREVALSYAEKNGAELVCPVLLNTAPARYTKLAEEGEEFIVLDGCATRCASKLAAQNNLKIARRVVLTEEAKKAGVKLGETLRLDEASQNLCKKVLEMLEGEAKEEKQSSQAVGFEAPSKYQILTHGKFQFRVPEDGFYFNENDCWVQVAGTRARIGVTDYVQQSLSDIMFFDPPAVGAEVEQFGEVGSIESGKAVFEVVSPVSGKIVAVNTELDASPELINQNPYEKGWIAEIELADFAGDQDLLLDAAAYLPILKKKVEEFHV